MTAFKPGDRVVLNQNYFVFKKGELATVHSFGDNSALLTVIFDSGKEEPIYGYRFDRASDEARPVVKDTHALLLEYGEVLRRAIETGETDSKYCRIGIFATFLMEYNNLEGE